MDARPTTFRVRRVPPQQTFSTLAAFLNTSVDGLGGDSNIIVRSLAPSPLEHSIKPTSVATIEFTNIPKRFDDGKQEWTVYLKNSRKFLLFDKNFRGFTPLNDVKSGQYGFE
jgi:hypothetical protein